MRAIQDTPRNDAEGKAAGEARKTDGRIRHFFKRNAERAGTVLLAAGVGLTGCAKAADYLPAACMVETADGARSLSAASAGMEVPLKGGKVLNVLSVDEARGIVTVSVSIGPVRSEPKEINSGSVADVAGVAVSVCGISDGEASISTNPGPDPERRTIRNRRNEALILPICNDEPETKQRAAIVRAEVLIDGEWVEKVIAIRLELDEPLHPAKYISRKCSIMLGEKNLRVMAAHQNGNIELLGEVKMDGDVPRNSLLMLGTGHGPIYVRIYGGAEPGQRSDSLITITNERDTELYEAFVPSKWRNITFTSPEGGGELALGIVPSRGDEASRMVAVLAGIPASLFDPSIPYYRTPEGTYWITGIEADENGLRSIEMVLERVPFPEGFGGH